MDKRLKTARKRASVAETFLAALVDNGIEYIFANAGTDFAPVIEALVSSSQAGNKVPQFITVPHENVAMAMAEGYYRVSGKPAAVMVHVTVGTANTICGVMNASRDSVPILVMAGRTPLTESDDIGSRNIGIHWTQENFDQAGMLREYVKWDYELRDNQPVEKVVNRALDIAMSEPRGPVYLTLPREVLGHTVKKDRELPRNRPLGNMPSVPSSAVLKQAVDMIAGSKNPLIIAGSVGYRHGVTDILGGLAEKFALPVVQVGGPSLLSGHPMNLGFSVGKYLPDADLVLVIESAVPWVPRDVSPNNKAKLIHLSPDPQYSRLPYRGFEMDVAISGEPLQSILLIEKALENHKGLKITDVETRAAKITKLHNEHVSQKKKLMEDAANHSPILASWVARCINRVKADDSIIVSELGLNMDHIEYKVPSSVVSGAQAGGLGFGLGASLGAKLAEPKRDVIFHSRNPSRNLHGPSRMRTLQKASD